MPLGESLMRNPIDSFITAVGESLGRPLTLERWIDALPSSELREAILHEAKECIDEARVTRWDRFGSAQAHGGLHGRGELHGWRQGWGGQYSAISIVVPALAGLCERQEIPRWECDLQAIAGMSASKSDLHRYNSMDDFAKDRCRVLIEPITEATLEQRLDWTEIRVLHQPGTTDHFVQYGWDGRIFLRNSSGSHHVAAARYLAGRLGRRVPITSKLVRYSIDATSVAVLRRDFEIFALPIGSLLLNGFFDGMQAFEAPYYWLPLPMPHRQATAIFLPRKDRRARIVARTLARRGLFDLGAFLTRMSAADTACGATQLAARCANSRTLTAAQRGHFEC
jgi:hypothetical protein